MERSVDEMKLHREKYSGGPYNLPESLQGCEKLDKITRARICVLYHSDWVCLPPHIIRSISHKNTDFKYHCIDQDNLVLLLGPSTSFTNFFVTVRSRQQIFWQVWCSWQCGMCLWCRWTCSRSASYSSSWGCWGSSSASSTWWRTPPASCHPTSSQGRPPPWKLWFKGTAPRDLQLKLYFWKSYGIF